MPTTDQLLFILKLTTALGCGLVAGAFFAFSSFVMGALAKIQQSQGMTAMQSINIVVINPVFMLAFIGSAAACLFLGIVSVVKWSQPGSAYLLAGSLLYLLGTFIVTIAFNVPLNDALAKANPASPEGLSLWSSYIRAWTMWNHVRSVAALAATASFILALCRRAAEQ